MSCKKATKSTKLQGKWLEIHFHLKRLKGIQSSKLTYPANNKLF